MSAFEQYLQTQHGATVAADGSVGFGPAGSELALATSPAVKVPLLDLAIVRVTGAGAREFLHAQFSSDLRELTATRASFSAWCTPKGRVLFLFHLVQIEAAIYVIVPRPDCERFVKRLRMFVLRAPIAIDEVSGELAVMGVAVPEACTWRPAAVLPASLHAATATVDGLVCVRWDPSVSRFLLLGPAPALADAWERCPLPAVGTAAWRLADIRAGLPRIDARLAEQFLPQNLNLDMLGAMSFNKGCYPGQEIIARLKFRGEIKARLLIGALAGGNVPVPGTKLHRQKTAGGPAVGQIVMSAGAPDGTSALLAVVDLAALAAAEPIYAGTPDSAQISFVRPPYWLDQ